MRVNYLPSFRVPRMRPNLPATTILLLCCLAVSVVAQDIVFDLNTEAGRARTAALIEGAQKTMQADAVGEARKRGWPLRGTRHDNGVFELIRLLDGRPLYYTTWNEDAAISTTVNLVHNTAPYNLSGTGLIAGVWDAGAIRLQHQEFSGRVVVMDGSGPDNHATHVGGTIGATGINPWAQGMATSATLYSFDWNNDSSEMTRHAATGPGQEDKVYVSNHSYGYVAGWNPDFINGQWRKVWFGVWGEREDRGFGIYDVSSLDWDVLCYNAPYYLPFKSSGNNRTSAAPPPGERFYYFVGYDIRSKTYDPATDPHDVFYKGGFDTIPYHGVAKNIMTVGAVNDAVSAGTRNLTNATMSSFSSWGPSDDGRIKPDIVANGVMLFSPTAQHNSAYDSYSGTSMSSPNAAGSALLLIEQYRNSFPGRDMRSSTLKGLIIHTADDLGNPGPDYSYGWGLMNTKAAADHIREHAENIEAMGMVEAALSSGEPVHTYTFSWNGVSAIRATLCWTDPPGFPQDSLNSTTPMLVNDLDLRVIGPGGAPVFMPFVLNPSAPNQPATTGDNRLDNVEQVYIAQAPAAGQYTVQITHKGELTDGRQEYALLLSGQISDSIEIAPATPFISSGPMGGPFSPAQSSYTLSNGGRNALEYRIEGDERLTWAELSTTGGSLEPGTSHTVTLTVDTAFAATLAPGEYPATLLITNVAAATVDTVEAVLEVRPFEHFLWHVVDSPQVVDTPFTVTITAADRLGFPVTPYRGTAAIAGFHTREIGADTYEWAYPLFSYYHDARTQVVYWQEELGEAATLLGLALDVVAPPGQRLDNWTIRMKHTGLETQLPPRWEGPDSGWTIVFQEDASITETGWVWFHFAQPFHYDGASNLLIDFSFDNDEYSTNGIVRFSSSVPGRTVYYHSDSDYGTPLDWENTSNPEPLASRNVPNIRLATPGAVTPATSTPFVAGRWTGHISTPDPSTRMFLRAQDGDIVGYSNDFDVVMLDFGDAPDPGYPTLLASNGARHGVGPLYLGTLIDAEPDGQPCPEALGDDLAGLPDEDGVLFVTPLMLGEEAVIEVTASMPGLLDAWIDFNGNGHWNVTNAQIFRSQPVDAGAQTLTFTVPGDGTPTQRTFARFRLSSHGGLMPSGLAADGEVEDYAVAIGIAPPAIENQEGSVSHGRSSVLRWRSAPGAQEYYAEIADSPAFDPPLANSGWTETLTHEFLDLLHDTTYFYRAKSRMHTPFPLVSPFSAPVSVRQDRSAPVDAWPVASVLTYGQRLGDGFLTGGASPLSGRFYFTDPQIRPHAGVSLQWVSFAPEDELNYIEARGEIAVTVQKATPRIQSWPTASAITYGQRVSASTLSGGNAEPPGDFAFVTPGIRPAAGNSNQSVRFTPHDEDNYLVVTNPVSVQVNKATPEVQLWPTASSIPCTQPFDDTLLNGGSASVPGSFEFTETPRTLDEGTASLAVRFRPGDAANYETVTGTVSVTVTKSPAEVTLEGATAVVVPRDTRRYKEMGVKQALFDCGNNRVEPVPANIVSIHVHRLTDDGNERAFMWESSLSAMESDFLESVEEGDYVFEYRLVVNEEEGVADRYVFAVASTTLAATASALADALTRGGSEADVLDQAYAEVEDSLSPAAFTAVVDDLRALSGDGRLRWDLIMDYGEYWRNPAVATLTPRHSELVSVDCDGEFTDPGADAVDVDGATLDVRTTVTLNGIEVEEVGADTPGVVHEITYTATPTLSSETLLTATRTVTTLDNCPRHTLRVSPDQLTVDANAGEATLYIETDAPWAVSSDADWIAPQEPGSGVGNAELRLLFTANTGSPRFAHVTITGTETEPETVSIAISQASSTVEGESVEGELSEEDPATGCAFCEGSQKGAFGLVQPIRRQLGDWLLIGLTLLALLALTSRRA